MTRPLPLGAMGSGARMISTPMRLMPVRGSSWARVTLPFPFRSVTTTSSWLRAGTNTAGRTVEDLVANPITGQRAMIGMAEDLGSERVLGADAIDGRRRQPPLGIDPVLGDEDLVAVPVVDFRGVDGDVAVALDGGADDAPGLAGPNGEIVGGVEVAAGDRVLAIVGIADGVLVIDLVAAAGEEAALVHFDDVADAFHHPLDAAIAARLALLIVNGGDQDVLGV